MNPGRFLAAVTAVCAFLTFASFRWSLWTALGVSAFWPTTTTLLLTGLAGWATARWYRRVAKPRLDRITEGLAPRAQSAQLVSRWGDQSRAQHGLASTREVRRNGSHRTVRAKTAQVRPSMADMTRVQRATRVATSDVGVLLCSVGGRDVYASLEDVVLVCAGPRKGKTGWMAETVDRYPGPVVSTSTRKDLYLTTIAARRRRGPVWVFNAAGFGGIELEDECGFNPLEGCTSPEVASARACDMIPAADDEEGRWARLARAALASLLHAAAIGGHDMDTVQQWAARPGEQEHKSTIVRLLRRSPSPATLQAAEQFLTNNDKTRSSITTSIMPALQWLESPAARAAAGLDGARARPFRAGDLLASGGTLYILGLTDEHTHVTPLMAALCGHVAAVARDTARHTPTGRLDPPLGMCLDEAAKVAPPLPDWSADMGGTGITLIAAFQSHADIVDRWGRAGAARLMNNAGAKMLGGGTADHDDLGMWTALVGSRDERTHTYDADGKVTSTSQRSVEVLSPAQLSQLPPATVVVFRDGMRPAIGRLRLAWTSTALHRRALQALRRAAASSLHLQRWAEASALQPQPSALQPSSPPAVPSGPALRVVADPPEEVEGDARAS